MNPFQLAVGPPLLVERALRFLSGLGRFERAGLGRFCSTEKIEPLGRILNLDDSVEAKRHHSRPPEQPPVIPLAVCPASAEENLSCVVARR